MKTIISALFILVSGMLPSSMASAQALTSDRVPVAVKQGCQTKFPSTKQVEWKLKSDKNYEAEFTLKGTEIAAKFDSTGKWLETESAISRSKVPKAVRETVAKAFKDYKVIERQSVQRWNEEKLVYELHLDNGKEVVKAQFSSAGLLLSQSSKPKVEKGK